MVLLEPESSGLGLVDAAARLGFAVQVLDRRPLDEAPPALSRAVAEGAVRHARLDTRDVDAVGRAAAAVAGRGDVRAVVPGFEYAVDTAAVVAARLGLPGLAPGRARALRDKRLMKQALERAEVPVARWLALPDGGAVDGATARAVDARCGYPAVVKPVDGCGSVLVRRVDNPDELRRHAALARRRPVADLGRVVGRRLLVEAYVAGPEVSVEGFVAGGDVVVAAVTAKRLGPEPNFVEVGHAVEAALPAAERARLVDVTVRAVRALGITVGGFHLEARLTPSGPVVMEVGARLGGDRIPTLVALARRWDLHDAVVRSFVGLPVPARAAGRDRVAAVRFFTSPATARLRGTDGLVARVARVAGCREVELYVPEGARVGPATDFRHRFGHAVVVAAGRAALEDRLAEVDRAVVAAVAAKAA